MYEEQIGLLDSLQEQLEMDARHRYTIKLETGRKSLYGVTSLIGQLAKPGLENWKLKVERKAVLGVAWLNPCFDGEFEEDYVERIGQQLGEYSNKTIASKAADRGHQVHAAVEAFLKNEELPKLDGDQQVMFDNWLGWWADCNMDVVRAEFRLASKTFGYAGTADALLIKPDGKLVLADWKTSKSSKTPYDEYRLQSAAYRGALYELGFPQMESIIVQIDRDGNGIVVHRLEDDYSIAYGAFCGLVNVARWKETV